MLRELGVLIGLSLLTAAQIARANEDPFCSIVETQGATVIDRVASISAGKVTAGNPVPLRGLVDNASAPCSDKPCVANGGVAGVELRRAGAWVCVGLPGTGKLGTTFGWLPVARWHSTDSAPQPDARWVGVWQNERGKISVASTAAGQIAIEGHALWVGGPLLQPHFGEFEVNGSQIDGVVSSADSDSCQVAVRVVGDFLVAEDNGGCGGMNVHFDGMYRLRHR